MHTVDTSWLESFVRTLLDRDLPALGVRVAGPTLRRFRTLPAHRRGQLRNSSAFIVVRAGRDSYRLADGVRAVAGRRLDADPGL